MSTAGFSASEKVIEMIGHRIYCFVNRYDKQPDAPAIYSCEAYSEAEARIILAEILHVTALSLIDVTDCSQQPEREVRERTKLKGKYHDERR